MYSSLIHAATDCMSYNIVDLECSRIANMIVFEFDYLNNIATVVHPII